MTEELLEVLLAAAEPQAVPPIRERLGLPPAAPEVAVPTLWAPLGWETRRPASALLWMVECDRPEINELVFFRMGARPHLRRDILRGLRFGDSGEGPLTVPPRIGDASGVAPDLRDAGPAEVVQELRQAWTMRRARPAANLVQRDHWHLVEAADREQPLPGYARWALAIRVDCPPDFRQRLGTGHPAFAYRMRQAGIVPGGPAEYVRQWGPASTVLSVLAGGRWAFPHRLGQALAELRPAVRDQLGENLEAWAVAAQLLPTFVGTLPELVTTAAAIA